MNTMVRSACSTGEFNDPVKGCQLCSWIQSPYQEILCPCEPSRDAVIGCKLSAQGNNICRPRTDALYECARRGYTSSRAPSTTAATGSTSAPTVASVSSSRPTTAAGESLLPRPTVSSNDNASSSASSDTSHVLALSVGLTIPVLVFVTLLLFFSLNRLRRKFPRRRRVILKVGERETLEISTKLIGVDSAASHLTVNGTLTPKVANVYETPAVPSPSVINNYNVIIKDKRNMQVGTGNIMTVAKGAVSVIGSTHKSDADDEVQVFYSGDLSASGDVNFSTGSSSLTRLTSGGEFAFLQPVQGYFSDLREEGNACPTNAEISDTWDMPAESFPSRSFSASNPGEEQYRSSQSGLEPAEVGYVPHRNSVSGLWERSEELSGSHHRGYDSAASDNSHMPTENADYSSRAMAALATLPAEVKGRNSGFEPSYSSPYDKECHIPSVSNPSAQASSSLSNSGHDSADGVSNKESLPVLPPALQSVSTGKPGILASLCELPTGEAVQNMDDDVNLPTPSEDTPSLSVIIKPD